MAAIVAFLVVHVALVVIVPKTLPPMITGRAPVHSEDRAMRNTPSSLRPRHDSTTASKELLRASGAARQIERRLFLKQGLSLGALTLLTGCDVTDTTNVQRVLNGISEWNDRTQAAIFNPRRLMPTYPESRAIKDFRYNAYFGQSQVPKVAGGSSKTTLSVRVRTRHPETL